MIWRMASAPLRSGRPAERGEAKLISIEAARARVLAAAGLLEAIDLPLEAALDRVLAIAATSPHPAPPFDNSAMDGYAVRSADLDNLPTRLRLVAESRAGSPAAQGPAAGDAVAISTGAALPEGADTVVRIEDTEIGGQTDQPWVKILRSPGHAANIRRAGEDIVAGSEVLAEGTPIGPAELGVLATIGLDRVSVRRRPRVAVVGTGDELVAPGAPLGPGQIHDSNRFTVAALVERCGGEVASSEVVGDQLEATTRALRAGLEQDVLIACGGVSVGPHDHVRPALAALGVAEHFWGIALRPGKPTWFGRAESEHGSTLVFGLPGNPVSAMVTFIVLVRPALRAMQGADPGARRLNARLAAPVAMTRGRTHLARCRLAPGPHGLVAEPTGAQGSHVLTSMLGAEALAIIPAGEGDLPAGAAVEVELLDQAPA